MFYLVYKITNTLNGKTYIGCHKTKDKNDGYMGFQKSVVLRKPNNVPFIPLFFSLYFYSYLWFSNSTNGFMP